MVIEDKRIELFPAAAAGAPLVIVNGMEGEGQSLYDAARSASGSDFTLAAISGIRWDDELTPWPTSGVFRGRSFTGRADAYLDLLVDSILPQIVGSMPRPPACTALAGYSLAGLFALYAACRCGAFARLASASGSLWYPGFYEYFCENRWARRPERVYLSVGDREAHARNAAMRTVEDNTRSMARLCREDGIWTRFELNPGGHFDDPRGRLAKAIAWLVAD